MMTMLANIYIMWHTVCQALEDVHFFLTVPSHHYYCNLYFTNKKNINNKCQILDVKIIFSGSKDFEFNHSVMEPICLSEVK